MKPIEFYGLVIISLANLIIGFLTDNLFMLAIAFVIAIILKPHLKYMTIPKGYLKLANIEEENLTIEDFSQPDTVIQLGVPPHRIDLITSITGVTWDKAFENRIAGKYGDLEVFFLGRNEYIQNKKATGRKKDLADLESIGVDSD